MRSKSVTAEHILNPARDAIALFLLLRRLLLLLLLLLLPGLIKRIFRFLLLQLLLLHHFALTAQRIRLRGPDRQRTRTAAADELPLLSSAHINHVFRHVGTAASGVWFAG